MEDVNNAIEELPMLGFSVMRTKTKLGSLQKVSEVARDVLWKERNRSIDCNFTYEDFISAVNQLDDEKGNPPTDRNHQNPAPPIVENRTPMIRHPTGDEGLVRNVTSDEHLEKEAELMKNSMAQLKEMCKARDDKVSGSKKELVARLLIKRKPEVLITRARRKQYIPKIPSCNAAILVAIFIHNGTSTEMMKKETIMSYAEETGISRDPMFGNGKSWYDGERDIDLLIYPQL
jgi:hypothetical protein